MSFGPHSGSAAAARFVDLAHSPSPLAVGADPPSGLISHLQAPCWRVLLPALCCNQADATRPGSRPSPVGGGTSISIRSSPSRKLFR